MKPTKRTLIQQTTFSTTIIAPSWLFVLRQPFDPHLCPRLRLLPANHILDINSELKVALQISQLIIILPFHFKQSGSIFDANTCDIVKSLCHLYFLHFYILYLLNNVPPLNTHGGLLRYHLKYILIIFHHH